MEKLDFAIIVSSQDAAGMNIRGRLLEMERFPLTGPVKADVFVRDEPITDLEGIDKEIYAGVFIFASRHVSRSRVHSLTVHSIGNWGKSMFGGKDRTLVSCPALLMKKCFKLLVEGAGEAGLDYEVMQEATHHGPWMEKPAMFIEIGSSEDRWQDKAAGKVVAAAITGAIRSREGDGSLKPVVGIGGMHHSPNFRKVMLSDDASVSYVCPKYMLEALNADTLRQAMEKSVPRAESVMLDWKGLGLHKPRIMKLLEDMGIAYARTRDVST